MNVRMVEIIRNECGDYNVKVAMSDGTHLYADRLNSEEALGEAARCLFGKGPHYAISIEQMIERERVMRANSQ